MFRMHIKTNESNLVDVRLLNTETGQHIPANWTNDVSIYICNGEVQANVQFSSPIFDVVGKLGQVCLEVNPDRKGHDDEVVTTLNLLAKPNPPRVRISGDGIAWQAYDADSGTNLTPIVAGLDFFAFEQKKEPWIFLDMEIESSEYISSRLDKDIFEIEPSQGGEYVNVTMKSVALRKDGSVYLID